MVACVALMIQSYLVTEDENEKINSGEEVFQLLVKLLDCSIRNVGYNGVNFAPIEVLEVGFSFVIIAPELSIDVKNALTFQDIASHVSFLPTFEALN